MIILTMWTNRSLRPKLDFVTLTAIDHISKISPRDARKIEPLEPGVPNQLLPDEKVHMIGHGSDKKVQTLPAGKKVEVRLGKKVSDL